jgi:hypothetical protein
VRPTVWCVVCGVYAAASGMSLAVRTGMRWVCNVDGGIVEEGEKTRVWTRREKTASQEPMRKDANGWVSTMPLPWFGDASCPPPVVVISQGYLGASLLWMRVTFRIPAFLAISQPFRSTSHYPRSLARRVTE